MPGHPDSVRSQIAPAESWWAKPGVSRTAWAVLQRLAQARMMRGGQKDLKPYGHGVGRRATPAGTRDETGTYLWL